MELEVGILRISRRDTRQGIVLREWFDMEIKPNYEGRVLDITPDIAYTCAFKCTGPAALSRCLDCCDSISTWHDCGDAKCS